MKEGVRDCEPGKELENSALLGVLPQRVRRRKFQEQLLAELGAALLLLVIPAGAVIEMPLTLDLRVLQGVSPSTELARARAGAREQFADPFS